MKSTSICTHSFNKATKADLNKLELAMYLYNNSSLEQLYTLKGTLIQLMKRELVSRRLIEATED